MTPATARSTAGQKPSTESCGIDWRGCNNTWTNKYTEAASTSQTMTLRNSRTLPSGRTAITVAPAPAKITKGHRQDWPNTATAAVEITMISMVAQPMFCAMLSTVGTTEPRRPTRPRSVTMAGAPVVAPMIAEAPSRIAPSPQPTTIAAIASPIDPAVVAISAPVSGPNRLMPRFAHIASWSLNRSGLGGSVVRVSGASVAGRSGASRVLFGLDVTDIAAPYAGIIRSGSVGRRTRCYTHSALSAHRWV